MASNDFHKRNRHPPVKGHGDTKILLFFSEQIWYSVMYGFSRSPGSWESAVNSWYVSAKRLTSYFYAPKQFDKDSVNFAPTDEEALRLVPHIRYSVFLHLHHSSTSF
jgi:hypothetical protein